MSNTLVEFSEFQRRRDELIEKQRWENVYRSKTKEMLLNELLDQQDKEFPLKKGSGAERKQFNALVSVLEEKAATSWLKQVLKTLKISD